MHAYNKNVIFPDLKIRSVGPLGTYIYIYIYIYIYTYIYIYIYVLIVCYIVSSHIT